MEFVKDITESCAVIGKDLFISLKILCMYVRRVNSYFMLAVILMGKLDMLLLPQSLVLLIARIVVGCFNGKYLSRF